jgi:hypothetical protein
VIVRIRLDKVMEIQFLANWKSTHVSELGQYKPERNLKTDTLKAAKSAIFVEPGLVEPKETLTFPHGRGTR